MIPDNLTIVVAVTAMVVMTLLAAGLVSAYQRHQQYRRLRIHGLVQGAQRAERLLEQLAGVSLPRDVRLLLRREILDRYRSVQRLHGGYPAVGDLLRQSEQRLNSEGGDAGKTIPVASDAAVFDQWQGAMQELRALLQHNGLLRPLAPATRRDYLAQVLERQAECLFGYYMNQADKLKQDGRHHVARNRIQQLQELLRSLGVNSERVQGLLAEAEAAYRYLLDSPVTGGAAQATAKG